jgi:hypothetical protein
MPGLPAGKCLDWDIWGLANGREFGESKEEKGSSHPPGADTSDGLKVCSFGVHGLLLGGSRSLALVALPNP